MLFVLTSPMYAGEILYPQHDTYSVAEGGQQNGALAEIWAGKRPSCGHDENTMIFFDLGTYEGETIESAILHMNRFFGCSVNFTNANFYHATMAWDETYDGSHIDHGTQSWANVVFNANGWWEIDITNLVQAWLDGDIINYGLVIECQTGSGTSKFHSKDAANQDVRPYLEIQLNETPTPTFTPGITPTPEPTNPDEPTPTPNPGKTYVKIIMPSDFFRPSDPCFCEVVIHNNDGYPLKGYPLCIVLNVYSNYFFAPDFTDAFQYIDESFTPGETSIQALPEFYWPSGAGRAENIQWLAALLTPDMTAVHGLMDVFTFGWGE